jgi:hypothetical protein
MKNPTQNRTKSSGLLGKVLAPVLVGAAALLPVGKVDGGYISPKTSGFSGVVNPYIRLYHVSGDTDGYDSTMDTIFSAREPPAVDFYSQITGYNLSGDSRGLDSLSTFNTKMQGNNLTYPASGNLNFIIADANNDFGSLPIYADIYKNKTLVSGNINVRTAASCGTLYPLHLTSNSDIYNVNVRFTPTHTLTIDLQKSFDNGMTWVSSKTNTPAGLGPVKITYSPDGLDVRNPATDTLDKSVGWTTADPFNSTTLGEYGLYTRGAAFGFNGTTCTNDRMKEEGRPLTSTSNILIEGYRNSDTVNPVYSENEKYKLVFSTDDPLFFNNFVVMQDEPYDFWQDPRYDSRTTEYSPYKVLSNPETFHSEPYMTLGSIINQNTGIGEMTFTAQGCVMDNWITEIDAAIGPTFSFDIFPQGGTPYDYYGTGGTNFYIEGGYAIWHNITPEPGALELLLSAALAGAGLCHLKRRKNLQ